MVTTRQSTHQFLFIQQTLQTSISAPSSSEIQRRSSIFTLLSYPFGLFPSILLVFTVTGNQDMHVTGQLICPKISLQSQYCNSTRSSQSVSGNLIGSLLTVEILYHVVCKNMETDHETQLLKRSTVVYSRDVYTD